MAQQNNTSRWQRLRRRLTGSYLIHVLGLALTLLVIWLHLWAPAPLTNVMDRLDQLIYDQRYAIMPKPERNRDHNIVIVDIDERSLQQEGQWPWDRFKLAELVRRLEELGTLVTGFDITFPESQRNPIRNLEQRVDEEQLAPSVAGQLSQLAEAYDADGAFADAIASGQMDVVLALSFNPAEPAEYGTLPRSLVSIDDSLQGNLSLREMAGYTANIEMLQEAASGAGIMNQLPDDDGVVRRIPLVVRYAGELYPTLTLEMARTYFFARNFSLLTSRISGRNVVEGVRIGQNAGDYEVPTDPRAQVLVPFVGESHLSGAEHYPYVSATDVLNGNVDAERFENALVLVGTTATGLFDLRSTPLASVFPGVEVHANVLNALLSSFNVREVESGQSTDTEGLFAGLAPEQQRHFPYKPVWEDGAMLVVLATLGIALTVALPLLGPVLLTVVVVALLGLAVWVNFQLWAVYRLDLTLIPVLLLVGLLGGLNMVRGFLSELRTRKTIKGMFDQYVPPAHIDAMLRNPEDYGFAGESREMTVLFSDIRSFTSISESLTAGQLKTLLNDFFTPITGIIFEHNGTIDKYVGDMVMAFWGAPLEDPRHRDHAVAAALDMLAEVENLRASFVERGLPGIDIGVGINTGVMNVGDMGSRYRRSYTVLGDAVNLGSRLEGLTKFYGARCLIGEETHDGLEGFLCRRVDRVKVKGKEEPVQVWEPLCRSEEADESTREGVERWHQALAAYYQQQWRQAREHLQALLEREPDSRLYSVYLERITELEHQDLPPDWDGVFEHTSK